MENKRTSPVTQAADLPSLAKQGPGGRTMLTYEIPLQGGGRAYLELPVDLTRAEANRLGAVIAALSQG